MSNWCRWNVCGEMAVRWYRQHRRKPRWLPRAKTKMFRISPRLVLTEAEDSEIHRLFNIYRTSMNSLCSHLKQKLEAEEERGQEAIFHKEEEEEHLRLMEENEAENRRLASLREAQLTERKAAIEAEVFAAIQAAEREATALRQKAEEAVRLQMERSKAYLKKEDLEKAIEEALANPVDYNFAIDLDGNIFRPSAADRMENFVSVKELEPSIPLDETQMPFLLAKKS